MNWHLNNDRYIWLLINYNFIYLTTHLINYLINSFWHSGHFIHAHHGMEVTNLMLFAISSDISDKHASMSHTVMEMEEETVLIASERKTFFGAFFLQSKYLNLY